jgi:hypothetical protein
MKTAKEALGEYLRTAQAHLIIRVDPQASNLFKCTPRIDEVERGWDVVIREGYDPCNSLLGCPVYWRFVIRGEDQLRLSTFVATRDQIIKGWGWKGLVYCDPVTGTAVARMEGSLPRMEIDSCAKDRRRAQKTCVTSDSGGVRPSVPSALSRLDNVSFRSNGLPVDGKRTVNGAADDRGYDMAATVPGKPLNVNDRTVADDTDVNLRRRSVTRKWRDRL